MKYTLWYYSYDENYDKLIKRYDMFTGTRYQCYKMRKLKSFSWQYRVLKSIW
jgi:hypothetical protein